MNRDNNKREELTDKSTEDCKDSSHDGEQSKDFPSSIQWNHSGRSIKGDNLPEHHPDNVIPVREEQEVVQYQTGGEHEHEHEYDERVLTALIVLLYYAHDIILQVF